VAPPVLIAAIVVWGAVTIYLAVRSRDFRKFLAGAFFVSAGNSSIFPLWVFRCRFPARALFKRQSLVPFVLPFTSFSKFAPAGRGDRNADLSIPRMGS
jgi:hypothetical protein